MKFGAMVATKIDDWQLLEYAETLGYDHAWVPDSQMIWSDCYATLALAAWHTSKIRLGTGVAIAPTRDPSVTAAAIASINRIAPGRVFLGIGTGHTAMRVMGFDPIKPKPFREYLRVVRGLLRGEEVEHTRDGESRKIRFLHRELGFIDVEHEIPIYIAANGPKALEAAGMYGDGWIVAGNLPPEAFGGSLAAIREGAKKAGRALPADFHTAALTFSCVLEPGETLESDRVAEETGSMVTAMLHFWWELAEQRGGNDEFVPAECRRDWDAYREHVGQMKTPKEKRYQEIHDGHCTYLVPAERRFVTPAMIRATGGLVGAPEEILEMLREREKTGLREVTLLPPMARARKIYRDFAEKVMARY